MSAKTPIENDGKFGKLQVIRELPTINSFGVRRRVVECKCSCGNKLSVELNRLRSGNTKSCGCLKKSMAKVNFTKHGKCGTKLYSIWKNIQARVSNKNRNTWHRYGGRGIKCLWENYEQFEKDMSDSFEKHLAEYGDNETTIERINNDGNYCKKNCRWATRAEQSRNTSRTKKKPTPC